MTIVVPFDGSPLSKEAVLTGRNLAEHLDRELVVLTVVPDDEEFAISNGWHAEGSDFDPDEIVAERHKEVVELAPLASFESMIIAGTSPEAIGTAIREIALDAEAKLLIIGSRNAGQIIRHATTATDSVGEKIAAGTDYNVMIIRSEGPEILSELIPESETAPGVPGRHEL